jgi:coenzyme F420 biosynthesis associated uncharacterized protein
VTSAREERAVVAAAPIDWATAQRIARAVAGRDALADSYLGASLDDDFVDLTVQAETVVADFTGLHAPGHVSVGVVDRRGWVDANVRAMRNLLAPLLERIGDRMNRSPFAPIGRHVAAAEMGALVGYMSRRVLGQYDLLVPDDVYGDSVYYVGPNILSLEKRFAFRPRDFRFWIAIHEVTHRAQFSGVPWMREHFLGLVHEAFETVDPDPSAIFKAISRALEDMRRGQNPLDDNGLVGVFASPEQRAVLQRVQALMSLLEGHGNAVMTELGRRYVPGEERMARVLHQRRSVGGLTGLLHKLFGFEQKMKQYEVGERFIDDVVAIGGYAAFDNVWRSPDNLPTLAELTDARSWIQRVDRSRVAG